MNDNPINRIPVSDSSGAASAFGTAPDPIAELRQRHEKAVQGGPGTGKGSGQLGKKRGAYRSRSESLPPEPAQPLPPSQTQETLNKKMGLIWKAVGMGCALASNCNVYLLDEEQQKLLGEAYGDLCAYFGIADTLAFKMVFCVGITTSVFGVKIAQHAAFLSMQRAEREKQKKDLKGDPPASAPDGKSPPKSPSPPGAPDLNASIHETKPGLL